MMWQFLMPTFVTFVHYHQEYDHTWVFEDDLWMLGKPIAEIFPMYDEKLKGQNFSLAGAKVSLYYSLKQQKFEKRLAQPFQIPQPNQQIRCCGLPYKRMIQG